MQGEKETNPKDAVGVSKAPLSKVPMQVVYEAGLGMLEGAVKYGASNYRIVGVRASVYYDALQRHMNQWWEGEDIDPDSGLSHVTKAISTLMVLRDAMLNDKLTDDRPPSVLNKDWMNDYNKKAASIVEKYKGKNPRHYTIDDTEHPPFYIVNPPVTTLTLPPVPQKVVDRVVGECGGPELVNWPKPVGHDDRVDAFTLPIIYKRESDFS